MQYTLFYTDCLPESDFTEEQIRADYIRADYSRRGYTVGDINDQYNEDNDSEEYLVELSYPFYALTNSIAIRFIDKFMIGKTIDDFTVLDSNSNFIYTGADYRAEQARRTRIMENIHRSSNWTVSPASGTGTEYP